MAAKKKPKRLAGISDHGGKLVDALAATAGVAHWERDQGSNDDAINEAQDAYGAALTKLCRYIAKLEKQTNV